MITRLYRKGTERSWQGQKHPVTYMYVPINIYIYIRMYIHIHLCVCVLRLNGARQAPKIAARIATVSACSKPEMNLSAFVTEDRWPHKSNNISDVDRVLKSAPTTKASELKSLKDIKTGPSFKTLRLLDSWTAALQSSASSMPIDLSQCARQPQLIEGRFQKACKAIRRVLRKALQDKHERITLMQARETHEQ